MIFPPLVKCKILLFADDLKIFIKIATLNDAIELQSDITTICNWCANNKLQLNTSKCFMLSFTRRTDSTFQYFNYNINGITLQRINSIRDLGVLFDSKLSFEKHIDNIVLSSCKMLGFISRSLNKFKKIETYQTLYNSYVRSILEYCAPIWSPYYDTHVRTDERVQKKIHKNDFPQIPLSQRRIN